MQERKGETARVENTTRQETKQGGLYLFQGIGKDKT